MKLIWLIACLFLTQCARAKDDIDNDISKSELELSSTTVNSLDANLRKALLRALTELENEDTSNKDPDDAVSKTLFFSTTLKTPERSVEKVPAAAISFVANDNSDEIADSNQGSDVVGEDQTEGKTEKPIVIIQKSSGIQHRPIISVLNDQPDEALTLSESSSFRDEAENKNVVRASSSPSLNPNAVTVNDKSFTPGVKSVSITPKYDSSKMAATTQHPTTSTEENEAKVENVQFFSAPLVAAFTVHQDERGLPNKVEPIFKQPGQSAISASEVQQKERDDVLRLEEEERNKYRQQLELEAKQKALVQQVLSLQEQHKQQHEHLLRQQIIIQEQQLQHQRFIEEQQRLSHNERPFIPIVNTSPSPSERPVFFTTTSSNSFNSLPKLPQINPTIGNFGNTGNVQSSTANPLSLSTSSGLGPNLPSFFQELPRSTPSPLFNQQLNQNSFNSFVKSNFPSNNFNQNAISSFHSPKDLSNNFQSTFVSLQPSVSLSPSDLQAGKLPLNAQILPVRNAIDFHQSPNPNTNIDLRPPSQQLLLNQQPQIPLNGFQQFSNNFVQSLPILRQGNRVFRHETSAGNLGFSHPNNANHFNSFKPPTFSIQQSLEPPSRFFRSNNEGFQQTSGQLKTAYQAQNANQQLNSLLYHSGITRNVRQNDDLHIVSKILSYNLGRDNLFASSRLNEHRLPKH